LIPNHPQNHVITSTNHIAIVSYIKKVCVYNISCQIVRE